VSECAVLTRDDHQALQVCPAQPNLAAHRMRLSAPQLDAYGGRICGHDTGNGGAALAPAWRVLMTRSARKGAVPASDHSDETPAEAAMTPPVLGRPPSRSDRGTPIGKVALSSFFSRCQDVPR
jgi:hypothetical protein